VASIAEDLGADIRVVPRKKKPAPRRRTAAA
jgi:hypothetical protein